jgi:DNA-directed RNA polymerase I, II, and III subunit RPABC2
MSIEEPENYFSDDDVRESDEEEEEGEEEDDDEGETKGEEDVVDDTILLGSDDDDDDGDNDPSQYLQKFDEEVNKNYILDFHPECAIHNKAEIEMMTIVFRDNGGIIVDDLHRTIPFLTKFERARIIGQRASQINSGSMSFIKNIPANIIDGYLIAEMELEQKTIPFIIRRPLPNGGSEYWKVKDLQNLL